MKTALTLATSSRGSSPPRQTKRTSGQWLTYPLASAILLGISVVAAASAQAQTFSVLYEFSGPPDGFYPYQETLLEVNGIFYGTTYYGGTGCCGTVFKVNSNGKETVLHSFTGGTTDVTSPNGGLVRDKNGNLYGVAPFGGHSSCGRHGAGCGAVFKLDTRGKESVFYEFPMGSAGWVPQGLIIDSAGNLYGATFYGGTEGCIYGCGVVFKLDTSGNETVLYKFIGGIEGGNPTGLLTRDLAGNLYGATNRGGNTTCQPYGCGVVFKLDPSGKETPLYSFSGGADGAYPNGSLVLDVNGNLYGTTGGGGDPRCDCGVVFEVTTAGKEKVLHTFKGANGANPAVGLLYAKGNAYGTTTYGGASNLGTVFELTSRGVEKVLHSFSGSDGGMPYSGLVMDAKGNVYGTTTVGGPSNWGTVFKIVP